MDKRTRNLFIGLFLAAAMFGVVMSQFSSSAPDGLEFVAEQEGFADSADEHALDDTPLAGYGEDLTGNRGLDTAVAALAGIAATLSLGYGLFWLVRRRTPQDPNAANSR